MLGIILNELKGMISLEYSISFFNELIEEIGITFDEDFKKHNQYSHIDTIRIIEKLSEKTGLRKEEILFNFGKYLFTYFKINHSKYMEKHTESFSFLTSVDQIIHREVLKLHPNAELPQFNCDRLDEKTLMMVYTSSRPFVSLALGLIEATLDMYGERAEINTRDLSTDYKTIVEILIKKR